MLNETWRPDKVGRFGVVGRNNHFIANNEGLNWYAMDWRFARIAIWLQLEGKELGP